MTSRTGTLRWQQIAWLGLCIVPCLVAGGILGSWVADAVDIPAWIGRACGFFAGYLASRAILRRYFVSRL